MTDKSALIREIMSAIRDLGGRHYMGDRMNPQTFYDIQQRVTSIVSGYSVNKITIEHHPV